MATTRIYLCYAHFPTHTHTGTQQANECVCVSVGLSVNVQTIRQIACCQLLFNAFSLSLSLCTSLFHSPSPSSLSQSFLTRYSPHISFVFQLIAQYLYLILIVFVSAWPVVQFNIYVSRHKTFHFAPFVHSWTDEQQNWQRRGRKHEGGTDKIMNCLHDYVMRTVSKEEDERFLAKLSWILR